MESFGDGRFEGWKASADDANVDLNAQPEVGCGLVVCVMSVGWWSME